MFIELTLKSEQEEYVREVRKGERGRRRKGERKGGRKGGRKGRGRDRGRERWEGEKEEREGGRERGKEREKEERVVGEGRLTHTYVLLTHRQLNGNISTTSTMQ